MDMTGTVPFATPGLLEMDWWPEIFFMVFRAPYAGKQYVFKKGDPLAQLIVVPKNVKYDIQPMSDKDSERRAVQQHNLENQWNRMCTRVFYCDDGEEFFDNKYKVLSAIAKRDGNAQAVKYMNDPTLLPHYGKNPQVVDNRPEGMEKVCHHAPLPEPAEDQPKPEPAAEVESSYEALGEDLGEVEDIIAQTDNFETMSDEELNRLIAAFKKQKRKQRKANSMKLLGKCDPKKGCEPPKAEPPKDEGWVLGHRIEKLSR
jgi:hypothetical protein